MLYVCMYVCSPTRKRRAEEGAAHSVIDTNQRACRVYLLYPHIPTYVAYLSSSICRHKAEIWFVSCDWFEFRVDSFAFFLATSAVSPWNFKAPNFWIPFIAQETIGEKRSSSEISLIYLSSILLSCCMSSSSFSAIVNVRNRKNWYILKQLAAEVLKFRT